MALPNLDDYEAKKVDGRITITLAVSGDNEYAVSTKKWNVETGKVEYDTIGTNLSEVDEKMAEIQAELDRWQAFKVDLQAVVA